MKKTIKSTEAQQNIKALFEAVAGDLSVEEMYQKTLAFLEENPHLDIKISKQYFRLITEGRAPDNPTMKKLFILHAVFEIPILSLFKAYGYLDESVNEVAAYDKMVSNLFRQFEHDRSALLGKHDD